MVGGSIGTRDNRFGHGNIAQRIGNGGLAEAGDSDDVARAGFIDRHALQTAEGQNFGDAALLDQLPVVGHAP